MALQHPGDGTVVPDDQHPPDGPSNITVTYVPPDDDVVTPSPTAPNLTRNSAVNPIRPRTPTEKNINVMRKGDTRSRVYGNTVAPGQILFAAESGGWLYVDYFISDGEIDGYEEIIVGGESEGLPAQFEYYTGTQSQSASPYMVAALGAYDALPGVAHVVAKLHPSNSLDLKAKIRGLKVYDPRTSPQTAYTTNPALVLADAYIQSGYTVDDASLSIAADYCDEYIEGSSPQEKRWEIGLPIVNRNTLKSWLKTLATYAHCMTYTEGGTVYFVPNKPIKSALRFTDGGQGLVDFGDVLDQGSTSFTIEMRVQQVSDPTNDVRLLTKDSNPRIASSAGYGVFVRGSTGRIHASLSDGTTQVEAVPAFTPVIGKDYHVAAVFRRGTNTLRLYFDGVEDSNSPFDISGVTGSLDNATSLQIGRLSSSLAHSDVVVSEVRLWNDARSAAEILANMNGSVDPSDASLQAYWKCDVGADGLDTLLDATTNNIDGTITGDVAVSGTGQHTITSGDVIGGMSVTKKGIKKVPEKVVVYGRTPDGEAISAETDTTGGSGQVSRLQLPGIPTFTMAKRMAIETYNQAQDDLRVVCVTPDSGLYPSVGDVGSITHAAYGLSGKLMRLVAPPQAVERGRWRRTYEEYNAASFDDGIYTAPGGNDTNLGDPNDPPTPDAPTIVEELFTDETATTYSRLKITWSGSDWPYTQNYRVTCEGEQNVLEAVVAHTGNGETHTVYTAALKQGVLYTCSLYVQSTTGVLSEIPATASTTAQGKLLPPGDVPSLSAYEAGQLVAMSWNPAEEIDGDLRGYVIKRLAEADYTDGGALNWSNAITITSRVDATTYLTAAQPAGDWRFGIKGIDNVGNESDNATWQAVTVTADNATNAIENLTYGTLTNMHVYTLDGDAMYAITSTGESWSSRFGGAATAWNANVSAGERWGGDLATDSKFESEIWALPAGKQGTWNWQASVTLYGGTRANTTSIGDASSPTNFTDHSGNTVQSFGQHLKAAIETTDSPASPGDGLLIRLPVQASFTGSILTQTGSVTVSATSPLDNPKTVTFDTAYASTPFVTVTATGSSAKIAVPDNVSTTGFDLYIFDSGGNKVDGTADWSATGT